LVFAVLLNGLTFLFVVLNPRVKNLFTVAMMKYLVLEDFCAALVCLIQCIMNYRVRGILGERVGCIIEAWQVGYFISITGYTLALIAYMVRLRVTSVASRKTAKANRNSFILKAHIVFWIVGALFTTGSTVWPGASRLTSSGTYCLAAFELFWAAFFFFGVAVFPTLLFLVVQYTWIFIFTYQIEKDLSVDLGQENAPKRKHKKLARQLGLLVLSYFLFYAPFLCSAIYEWTTGYFSPPWVDFTGVLVHIASVANPVIYLWTSNQVKAEIKRIWNEYFYITYASNEHKTAANISGTAE